MRPRVWRSRGGYRRIRTSSPSSIPVSAIGCRSGSRARPLCSPSSSRKASILPPFPTGSGSSAWVSVGAGMRAWSSRRRSCASRRRGRTRRSISASIPARCACMSASRGRKLCGAISTRPSNIRSREVNNNNQATTNANKEETMLKKLLVAGAALAALYAGSASADTTLKLVEVITSPERTEVLKGIVQGFETANPGTHVEIISLPWGEAFEKFATMVSAGQTPDVVEMPDTWQALYGNNGALEDLQPYVDKWDQGSDLSQKALDMGRLVGGKTYMLPYGFYLR